LELVERADALVERLATRGRSAEEPGAGRVVAIGHPFDALD
jgi:hypothetical protein